MKFWSNGQHIDLRCRRSAVRSRATSSFFFLFHQNFSFSPLFCFHYKFYIYVNARLPFKGYSKKIESSYSKFSMLLPNFQSPRLCRLVCSLGNRFSNLDIGSGTSHMPSIPFEALNFLFQMVPSENEKSHGHREDIKNKTKISP